MQNAPELHEVTGASGAYIHLQDGTKLIDGISSWWSTCHGYQHPHIINAMQKQLQEFSHVMFAGLKHQPAYILAERLAKLTKLPHCFYTDSGSTAVEVALKMAVQYWQNKGEYQRAKFISFRNGYHGDTLGCMSLADPEGWIHKSLSHYIPKQYVMDIPRDEYSLAEFKDLVEQIAHTTAGIIIEPLVQGAGGMKFHAADILTEIHRIAKKHNILLITDEIMTGFGRLGPMFAVEEAGISPDITCLGKGLTGGAIGLGVTMASAKVYEAFLDNDMSKALMHGPTFMGNPLSCAAANASLDLFEGKDSEYKPLQEVARIENQMREELRAFKDLKEVKATRYKGAIGVIELHEEYTSWENTFKIREKFAKQGVWLRPFGNIIYIMPPFIISEAQLSKIFKVIKEQAF